MQKFATSITSIVDAATKVIAPAKGAPVYIYQGGTNNLATLYQDNETSTRTNPLTTDDNGFVECKLANGTYDIVVVSSFIVKKVVGFCAYDGSQPTVTITMPAQFTVTNGTNVTWNKQTKNTFLAGPATGADAVPTFRAIVAADLPFTGTPTADSYLSGDLSWKRMPGRMLVQDQQAPGTAGGGFTQGAWRTRTLNTTVFSSIDGALLGTNQITLPAGSYMLEASAPAFFVEHHKARLQNITDGSTIQLGTSEYSGASGNGCVSASRVTALFTITATKAFELQHYAAATRGTDGFGRANTALASTEVYSSVLITKLA